MLTAAHFCRSAGEKQTKQVERKEKKGVARRQRSSKAEIRVTRLTPTPIVGFKKIFLFYLFLSWGGKIVSLKQFFCGFGCSVGVTKTKSLADKLAKVTHCVFFIISWYFPRSSVKRANLKHADPPARLSWTPPVAALLFWIKMLITR